MIHDTTETVMRWRFGVAVCVRLVATGTAAAGIVALSLPVLRSFANWGFLSWPDIRWQLVLPAALVMAGAGMGAGARRLARWFVPLERPACPGCDYAIDGQQLERCPECGLLLPTRRLPT